MISSSNCTTKEQFARNYAELVLGQIPDIKDLKNLKWKINSENAVKISYKLNVINFHCNEILSDKIWEHLESRTKKELEPELNSIDKTRQKLEKVCGFYSVENNDSQGDPRIEKIFNLQKEIYENPSPKSLKKIEKQELELNEIKEKIKKNSLSLRQVDFTLIEETEKLITLNLLNCSKLALKEEENAIDQLAQNPIEEISLHTIQSHRNNIISFLEKCNKTNQHSEIVTDINDLAKRCINKLLKLAPEEINKNLGSIQDFLKTSIQKNNIFLEKIGAMSEYPSIFTKDRSYEKISFLSEGEDLNEKIRKNIYDLENLRSKESLNGIGAILTVTDNSEMALFFSKNEYKLYNPEEETLVHFGTLDQIVEYLKNYITNENTSIKMDVLCNQNELLCHHTRRSETEIGYTSDIFESIVSDVLGNRLENALSAKNSLSQIVIAPITGKNLTISHLIDYHLYCIHNKELDPQELKFSTDDWEYGEKAFATQEAATDEERARAINRTQIEVFLLSLQNAIKHEDEGLINKIIEALTVNPMHSKDCPKSQEELTEISHMLYKEMYYSCLKAKQENNPLMENIDLDDSSWNGSFGEYAFKEKELIPLMSQAVQWTIESLQKTWS